MAERSGHARLPLVAVFLGIVCAPAAADEWPGLRGPNHDGSARSGSRSRRAGRPGRALAGTARLGIFRCRCIRRTRGDDVLGRR